MLIRAKLFISSPRIAAQKSKATLIELESVPFVANPRDENAECDSPALSEHLSICMLREIDKFEMVFEYELKHY